MSRRSMVLAALTAGALLTGCAPYEMASAAPGTSGGSYDREAFGDGWIDTDHDGCNTRAEVLELAAGPAAYDDSDRNHCRDDAPLLDVYTGRMVTPPKADVDHVLPLEKAWYAGMSTRPEVERMAFANDPRNLIATAASVNRSKGSDLPWDPPDPAARCHYARTVLGTANNWHLTLSSAQTRALSGMCP